MKLQHLLKFVFFLLVTASILNAANNLPNLPSSSTITGKDFNRLRKYFQQFEYLPGTLDDSIGKILLKNLPKLYQNGCKELISKWGKGVRGTSATAVKPIHLVNFSKRIQHVFLAYTCYSTAEGYEDNYYDERLAVLTIDSIRAIMTMIPLGQHCDSCTHLSHIGLYQDTLKIGGYDAISIIIGTSNNNPCCERNATIEEETLKYIIIDQDKVKDVLTLKTNRKENYFNNKDKDSTLQQVVSIETIQDENRNINTIILTRDTIINEKNIKKEIKKYIWNRKRGAFEEGLY